MRVLLSLWLLLTPVLITGTCCGERMLSDECSSAAMMDCSADQEHDHQSSRTDDHASDSAHTGCSMTLCMTHAVTVHQREHYIDQSASLFRWTTDTIRPLMLVSLLPEPPRNA